jgi:hypothetical protein
MPPYQTHATQKSLDYFIIGFLRFYQINATKVEKTVYYTRFIQTHCDTRSVEALLTAFVVLQLTHVTIKRLIKLV